jgi:energy-coupling factor transporter ATP-binding protein EcfA2
MVVSNRPLYATAGDAERFTNPAVWDKLLAHAKAGSQICVRGRTGSGKTTALHQLSCELDNATYVDASAVRDIGALIERIHAAITRTSAPVVTGTRQLSFGTDATLRSALPSAHASYCVEVLRDLANEGRRVLLLDATASATAAYGLFGRLRDELWQLDLRWVVAIDDDEAGLLLQPPASSFFDIVLSLDTWNEELLQDLLKRRDTPLTAQAITDIAQASNGSPRQALTLARRFLIESPQAMHSQLRRQQAAAKLGQSASRALAELEQLGEASASDERLLNHLGWSRERATQIMGALERQQIVTARMVRQPRGRPRKVYAPHDMF